MTVADAAEVDHIEAIGTTANIEALRYIDETVTVWFEDTIGAMAYV